MQLLKCINTLKFPHIIRHINAEQKTSASDIICADMGNNSKSICKLVGWSVNQSVSQSVSRTHLCMLPMAMIMKIVFFCRDVIPSSAQKIMTCFSTASLNSYEITRCQIQNNNNLLQFYFPFPLYPAHQTTTIHFYVLLTFTAFSFVLGSKFFCAKMIDY